MFLMVTVRIGKCLQCLVAHSLLHEIVAGATLHTPAVYSALPPPQLGEKKDLIHVN